MYVHTRTLLEFPGVLKSYTLSYTVRTKSYIQESGTQNHKIVHSHLYKGTGECTICWLPTFVDFYPRGLLPPVSPAAAVLVTASLKTVLGKTLLFAQSRSVDTPALAQGSLSSRVVWKYRSDGLPPWVRSATPFLLANVLSNPPSTSTF